MDCWLVGCMVALLVEWSGGWFVWRLINWSAEGLFVEESVGLSEKDKNNLFIATLGYQGGARPSREMEERYRKASLEAKAKIEEFGLTEEFKSWQTKRRKEKGYQFPMGMYPKIGFPTGMNKYSGGGGVPMSAIPLERT